MARAGLQLVEQRQLAEHLNSCVFHTRLVDALDEVLADTSDLALYWCVTNGLCAPLVRDEWFGRAALICNEWYWGVTSTLFVL